MSIKEKPFFDSVYKRSGPLPASLFSNPIVGGFVAVLMCAVFGAVGAAFVFGSRSSGVALEVFEIVRGGAIFGLALAAVVLLIFTISAFFQPEEAMVRALFVFGGGLAFATLAFLTISTSMRCATRSCRSGKSSGHLTPEF